MSNKKFKTEYIILILVVIFSLFYLIFRQNNRINYKLPQLKPLEIAKIDKIVIKNSENSIILKKEGEKWRVGDENYKANKDSVDKIIKDLSELNIVTLVSERKNYNLYELDGSNKIDVKAFTGNTSMREFLIGKVASTYDHTFVKLDKDPNVYQAEGSIKDDFSKSIDDLRDKTVLSVNKNDVTSIKIVKGNDEYLIKKEINSKIDAKSKDKKKSIEVSWKSDNKNLSKDKIESLLNRFVSLDCSSFIYDKDKNDLKLKNPIYSVELITPGKTFSVKIFERKEKDKGEYPAITSESKYFFFLNAYSAEQIMKDPKDFIVK